MEQKLQYNTITNEIDSLRIGISVHPEGENTALADIPDGFDIDEKILWKYSDGQIAMKTGIELDIAMATLNESKAMELINRYAGFTNSPITLGQIEGALDLVVQILNKFVNDEELTQEEKDKWNAFVSTNEQFFKISLFGVSQEDFDDMADAKAAARQAEVDMKNDPEWPES